MAANGMVAAHCWRLENNLARKIEIEMRPAIFFRSYGSHTYLFKARLQQPAPQAEIVDLASDQLGAVVPTGIA
jgi:hypothetical protein